MNVKSMTLKGPLKALNFLTSNREISIVFIIIFVLLMMVIPLPTVVMDTIIALNITLSVVMLMVVIYMQSPIDLTAFPSILLVLALLRIGITVSTSRLILLNGDAGEIVNTFGQFVVGGNLVVGIIIFVIITIINFIVITKGSERVAEVAARFSLDAMPGKQMSIDSDLKAGNITMEEAIQKRKNLGLESKLYGAMDGAMKFVKGDSIASIVDILVNLVGGLIIGVMQKGMGIGEAATTYSLLTVGDGLVQQIPALLVSLTAGIMITRVSDEDEDKNLGQSILQQVFSRHKPIFAACGLLAILAAIPGMPTGIFTLFLVFFGIVGGVLFKRKKGTNKDQEAAKAIIEDTGQETTISEQLQLQVLPLLLYFSPKLKSSGKMKNIEDIIISIRQQIVNELGVAIPQIVRRYSQSYEEDQYQLEIFEIPEATGHIQWDYILVMDNNAQELIQFENVIENQLEFGEAMLGYWVPKEYSNICDESQIHYFTCEQFLLLHIKYHILKHISDFLGLQEVKNILDKMVEFQELIKELLRMLPLNKIAEVFQRLVAENVSIRNFKIILDTLLEWAQRERDTVVLTEQVRRSLGRYIAYKFSKGTYLFACVILSSDVEDTIRDSIRYSDNGSFLSLDPHISDKITSEVKDILEESSYIENIILLTQFDIRRYVRSIIETELPFLPVLSFQELEGNAQFNSLGVVEI